MNIIEAVKTGKKFRRRIWINGVFCYLDSYDGLRAEDVLADDWEVEETQVTITEAQLSDAWEKADTKTGFTTPLSCKRHHEFTKFFDALKKELGL